MNLIAQASRTRTLFRRLGWAVLSGLLVLAAGYYGLPWLTPWPNGLNGAVPSGVRVMDRNGKPLRRLLADGKRSGGMAPLSEIPRALIEATVAAEDQRFFSHGGVDPWALGRAVMDGLKAGKNVSGASTISQQLIKLAHPRPRTWRTKLLEMLSARRLEMTWNKTQILEQYFARLEYGNLHRGPVAAALGYFGKPLPDCSLAECAFLAGLPQAPTRLNPWRDAAPAIKRQQWILGRLEALNRVDPATLDRARAEPLRLRRHFGTFYAPHFADLMLEKGTVGLPSGGEFRTSLDLDLQLVCETAVSDRLDRLAGRNVTQAAVVVIHNETGEVRALTGSRDYTDTGAGQVNGATARRSPGSALKPFTYLLALSADLSPADIMPDLPVEYMTSTGIYRPENYHHRAAGPVPLRSALANSLNLSAVRLLEKYGGSGALIASLQACGLTTLTRPPAEYGLGLTIGGGEVTLLELTAAYSTLARLGVMQPLKFTPVSRGAGPLLNQRVFDPDACWLLADILSDNEARARNFGTTSALRLPFRCAVKTGTSTDYRDNWAIGYNAAFTVGVWTGNFDGAPMRGVSGLSGAAPVFRDVFTWLDSRHPAEWYEKPAGIVEREVDPLTGLPRPEALQGQRPVVVEKFRRDLAPNHPDPSRYDRSGRVILPPEYAAWLAGPDNYLGASVNAAPPSSGIHGAWRIVNPVAGTTLLLDPDLPHGGRSLPLRVNPASAVVEWTSSTLKITNQTAWLIPGRHELTAHDRSSGKEATTWVIVRQL